MSLQSAPQPSEQPARKLWLLEYVALSLRWLEELLSLVNGPLLMFGAGIAVVDLLTDGALTLAVPALLFAWAISQALGIETQLLGCFARGRQALREGHGWAVVGWLLLGAILAYFAWQAGYVFAVQQSGHLSEAAALGVLGLPAAIWLGERAALAVGLVALSGWTRYHPPVQAAKPVEATADREARQAAEIANARHKAELRTIKAAGVVGTVRQAALTAAGKVDPLHPAAASADEPAVPGDNAADADGDGGGGGGIAADNPRTRRASAKREYALRLAPFPRRPRGQMMASELAAYVLDHYGRAIGEEAALNLVKPFPRRPRGQMTASELAAYVLDHYGRAIGEEAALNLVKTIPGAARLDAEKGQPWAAPKPQLLQRARQLWAEAPADKAREA